MKSLRTKITMLTVCAIVASMSIATLLGAVAIRTIGSSNSDEMLLLLCEAGEKNLDSYFESMAQSVEMVSAYAEADLEELELSRLDEHLERVKEIFEKMTYKTHGVLTYYYRIDPAVSESAQGFWYVNLDGEGFREHEVTDITGYDTEDTSALVWFTIPRATGRPVWLPPYITDNLDVRVISYNVPIYRGDRFVGVIGIEMDYSTMAEQVDHISLYHNGYAFINDADGTIIYHPRMDVMAMEEKPAVPDGLLSSAPFVRYRFDGVEKQAVWLPLSNGMRLYVTVPVSEINVGWHEWITQIVAASVILVLVFTLITMHLTEHITQPLRELAVVAERVNAGEYECRLDYSGNDEVGILTQAFRRLTAHLKTYISDLNDLAYSDALTSVHNKGAFNIYLQNLQACIDEADVPPEFAVCIFDCNNLKAINDKYGHDKGDIYLTRASAAICEVFSHSPVFRIGGDEFAVVLQGGNYRNRSALAQGFDEACAAKSAQSELRWEKVDVAWGMADYAPESDETVDDVVHRADKRMYEDKREKKARRGAEVIPS